MVEGREITERKCIRLGVVVMEEGREDTRVERPIFYYFFCRKEEDFFFFF